MGKVKWSVGSEEPEDLKQFDVYTGVLPPKGVYNCIIKFLQVTTNKNGDDMIKGLLIINETGEKKKYTGCPIWFNQNVTEQGGPYVKQFLKAIGVSWREFVSKTVTDDEDPPNITKIGSVKVGSGNVEVRVLAKRGSYNGNDKLDVGTFLPPKDEDDDDFDDDDDAVDVDDDDDGDEKPF